MGAWIVSSWMPKKRFSMSNTEGFRAFAGRTMEELCSNSPPHWAVRPIC